MADRRLQVFLQVAQRLSFTKAAESLHLTQPAVTFQVRQLESEIGAPLFIRAGNQVGLTEIGNLLLQHAIHIEAQYLTMKFDLGEAVKRLNNVKPIRLYRPSNSSEGFSFKRNFCDKCANLGDLYADDGGCEIEMRTMLVNVEDPTYPAEWRYEKDDDGDTFPACTAFVSKG